MFTRKRRDRKSCHGTETGITRKRQEAGAGLACDGGHGREWEENLQALTTLVVQSISCREDAGKKMSTAVCCCLCDDGLLSKGKRQSDVR